ncbi:MAG TPA: S8/S53 family peptidase [Alphaproteobacteria bacterium]|nr:S8/S53 family peptidase [Alphaproteobacteria bacterium]
MIRTLTGALAATAFFYSAQAGQAEVKNSPAEQAAAQACATKKPFAVLDNFKATKNVQGALVQAQPDLDLNGDLTYADKNFKGLEGLHGDLVSAIAGADGRPVISLQLTELTDVGIAQSLDGVASAFENASDVERPAALIFSVVIPINLFMVKDMLGDRVMKITLENIHEPENSDRIKRALFSMAPLEQNPYYGMHQAFERLQKLGVPVFVAAGNYGPVPIVNLFSLFPGVHTVGALDRQGLKSEFANNSSLVGLWRKGSFTMKEVPGGIDINNDGRPEFTGDQLSTGESVAVKYTGKKASETVKAVPDIFWLELEQMKNGPPDQQGFTTWHLAEALPEGLYPTKDMMTLFGQEMLGQTQFNIKQGQWMHHPSKLLFTETPDGFLIYDPDRNGDPAQRASWDGTSYAAPNICEPGLVR